jgi:hypothetical protein
MSDQSNCAEVGGLLPELAVGAVVGDERARALAHIGRCLGCHRELAEFAAAADAVLQLAPSVEPPPGFENAVLGRLGLHQPPTDADRPATSPVSRRRHARRLVAVVIAMVISLGAGAALAQWRTAEDRRLADQYRHTLAVANGRYLKAAPLTWGDGERVGTTYLYQGNPSWLLVTTTAAPSDGSYAILAFDRDGGAHRIGTCQVTGRTGTAGYELPLRVADVARIQLRSTTADTILTSTP